MTHWPTLPSPTLLDYVDENILRITLDAESSRDVLALAWIDAQCQRERVLGADKKNIATLYAVEQKALERAYFALCTAEMMEAGASEITEKDGRLVPYRGEETDGD